MYLRLALGAITLVMAYLGYHLSITPAGPGAPSLSIAPHSLAKRLQDLLKKSFKEPAAATVAGRSAHALPSVGTQGLCGGVLVAFGVSLLSATRRIAVGDNIRLKAGN
jgi:hypothetical protein